nr:MAG TPA: DnaB-like replicative helicase [Caudoviricetes sp.]
MERDEFLLNPAAPATADKLNAEEAEWALLGCCFQDSACVLRLSSVNPDCFTSAGTKALYRAILSLSNAAQVDIVTVSDKLRQSGVENAEELAIKAASMGFLPSMFDEYAAILDRFRIRRMLSALGWKLWQEARREDAAVDSLVAEAAETLSAGVKSGGKLCDTREALMDFMDWVSQKPSANDMLPSGIPDLDRVIGGFQPGQLIVLAARPKVGKSALATFMAQQIAKSGGEVLFVSLEMGKREIMRRRIAMESGVDLTKISRRTLDVDDFIAMGDAYARVDTQHITYDEGAYTPNRVAASARELLPKGLKLIVIDYLQLMDADRKTGNRTEAVSAVTRDLKRLAMQLKVPILCMSQFNRDSEKGEMHRMPTVAELRESGSIEQDANMVLILHEPNEPSQAAAPEQWQHYQLCKANGWAYMLLKLAASRETETGIIQLAYDKPHVRFMCFERGEGSAE